MAELTPEEFADLLRKQIIRRVGFQLQNTTEAQDFQRRLQSPELWTPIAEAGSLSAAIDVAYSQIFPAIEQFLPTSQTQIPNIRASGFSVGTSTLTIGPGSPSARMNDIRIALEPEDNSQALTNREALVTSSIGSTLINDSAAQKFFDFPGIGEEDIARQAERAGVVDVQEERAQTIFEGQLAAGATPEQASAVIDSLGLGDFLNVDLAPAGIADNTLFIATPPGFEGAPLPSGFRPGVQGFGQADEDGLIPSRYEEGDQFTLFQGKSIESVAQLQVQLVETGLLGTDNFIPGVWDPVTADAMRSVMGFSNFTGRTWQFGLTQLALAGQPLADEVRKVELADGRGPQFIFSPQSFRSPDPAALANQVFNTFRSFLGRDPNREELASMMQVLGNATLEQFRADESARFAEESSVAQTQAQIFQENQAAENARRVAEANAPTEAEQAQRLARGLPPLPQPTPGEVPATQQGPPLVVSGDPGSVPDVSPGARFAAAFQERFAGEVAFRDRQAANTSLRSVTQGGFLSLLNAMKNNPFA